MPELVPVPVPVPVPVLVAVAQPPQVGSHEAGFVHQVQPLPEHVLWVVPIHDPDPAEIEQHAPGGGGGGLEHMGETSSPVFSSMVPGAPPHPFGVPIEIAYPKEGVVLDWWGFGIPKNARNKSAAYEFLNAALSDSAQAGYSSHLWSAPPTTTGLAAIAEPIRRQLQFPPDVKILSLDEDYLYLNDAQLKAWWDRTFKA